MLIQCMESRAYSTTQGTFKAISIPGAVSSDTGGGGGMILDLASGDYVITIQTADLIIDALAVHTGGASAGLQVDDKCRGGRVVGGAEWTFDSTALMISGVFMLWESDHIVHVGSMARDAKRRSYDHLAHQYLLGSDCLHFGTYVHMVHNNGHRERKHDDSRELSRSKTCGSSRRIRIRAPLRWKTHGTDGPNYSRDVDCSLSKWRNSDHRGRSCSPC